MTESILIVQSGFLGDAVLASGMLRGIASQRPDISIGLVVRAEFVPLFEAHPALARVHPFHKRERGGTARLVESLRGEEYRLGLIPHRSFRSSFVVRRAGISRRVGFRQSDAPWLLTDRVNYDLTEHETDRNSRLVERIGLSVPPGERGPWLVPERELVDRLRRRFDGPEHLIVIAPGSVWPTKQWTIEGYCETARRLRERGYRVVLSGAQSERVICQRIAEGAGIPGHDIVAGELSLPEVLALISLAERVITNDSAPLHLAESVGTPVTALFGPTVPEFGFGPRAAASTVVELRDLACRPCGIHGGRDCPIGTHACMVGIDSDMVFESMFAR